MKAKPLLEEFKQRLQSCGITYDVVLSTKSSFEKPKKVIYKNDIFKKTKINELKGPIRSVEMDLTIFKIEENTQFRQRNQSTLITYYLKDDTGYILARKFFDQDQRITSSTPSLLMIKLRYVETFVIKN